MGRRSFLFSLILMTLLLTGCSYDLLSSLFDFTSAAKENVISPGNIEALVEKIEGGVDGIPKLNEPKFSEVLIEGFGDYKPILSALDSSTLYAVSAASENTSKKKAIRDALSAKANEEQAELCRTSAAFMKKFFNQLYEVAKDIDDSDKDIILRNIDNFRKDDIPADYVYTKRDVLAFSLEVYLFNALLSYYPIVCGSVDPVSTENIINTIMSFDNITDENFKRWIDRVVGALASVKNALNTIGNGSVDTITQGDINSILESILEVE